MRRLFSQRWYGWLSFSLLLLMLIQWVCQFFQIGINVSASMPLGIYHYRVIAPKRHDWVLVCIPQSLSDALNHHSRFQQCKKPLNGSILLKQLIALPGDKIEIQEDKITVNGKTWQTPRQVKANQLLHQDHWPSIGNTTTQSFWVAGIHDYLNAFDSRYFGGLPEHAIVAVAKPIWIWSSRVKNQFAN